MDIDFRNDSIYNPVAECFGVPRHFLTALNSDGCSAMKEFTWKSTA